MFAVWPWIKWFGLAGLFFVITVLWLKLSTSQAQQLLLTERLSQSRANNQSNLTVIDVLKNEAQKNNKLLVKRQRKQTESEEMLNAEITGLKAQLSHIQCAIPDDVTQRLRRPY